MNLLVKISSITQPFLPPYLRGKFTTIFPTPTTPLADGGCQHSRF